MANIPALSLTAKTAEEIRNELIARIPTLTDRWTDFNDHDLGVVVLTVLSGMLESMQLELDIRASETTVTHVRQRPNGVRLLKLIGFEFKRKTASTTTLRFSVPSVHSTSIPIVPYFDANPTVAKTRSATPLYFTPTKRTYIPANNLYVDVTALQGQRGTQSFTAVSGIPDQLFILSSTDIAEDTLRVKVNGIFWTEVESFYDSKDTDRHYIELTDEQGNVMIQFGDGVSGSIPSGNVEVVYLITSGKNGNVFGTNRITELTTSLLDVNGNALPFSVLVSNTESAVGGDDQETVFHAKKVAPRVFAAQQRSVTKPDFEAWSEKYPGIRQAKCFDITDVGAESFDIDYFEVKIAIIPTSGNYPSAALKKALQDHLEILKDVPDNIEVIDPEFVPVDVSVDLYVKKPPVDPLVVKANVQTAIQNFFTAAEAPSGSLLLGIDVDGQVLGGDIDVAKMLAEIQKVDGVASVTSFSPSSNVSIDAFQIATLANGSPVVNILGVV